MMTLSPAATRPAPVLALGLTEPLPGFPSYRDYALVAADPEGRLSWLQSLDPDGPRFLVVPPAVFFPDYSPVLPGTVRAELGLPGPADRPPRRRRRRHGEPAGPRGGQPSRGARPAGRARGRRASDPASAAPITMHGGGAHRP